MLFFSNQRNNLFTYIYFISERATPEEKQQEKEENMPIGTIGGYYANMGHTTGGASGTNLRTYVGSAQDSAHEKLVRGIAKEMKSLGITGVNANESDLNKVCSQMMSAMPKGVKKDGNMHKDLTKKFLAFLYSMTKYP